MPHHVPFLALPRPGSELRGTGRVAPPHVGKADHPRVPPGDCLSHPKTGFEVEAVRELQRDQPKG